MKTEGIAIIRVDLPSDIENIEIIPIGDVHIGEELTDERMFKDTIKYILEKPNRFVILNGDLMDMALTMSVSDTYGASLQPEEQVKHVARLLKPLVEQNRILAMGTGNHEDRVYKHTGIDASRYLAYVLGIEERYSSNSFIVHIRVGKSYTSRETNLKKQCYSIFVQHGSGGGRKNGGKLNRLNDSDQIVANCDIYIMGHVHVPIANVMTTFLMDNANGSMHRHNKYYILNNAWQDFGGYGLKFGFSPSAKEITYATLYTQGKKRIKLHIGI